MFLVVCLAFNGRAISLAIAPQWNVCLACPGFQSAPKTKQQKQKTEDF